MESAIQIRACLYPGILVAVFSVLGLVSCGKPGESAKSDLAEADFQMTQADWFRAVREGNVAAMKRFRDAGFDIQAADERGRTALHEAAAAGVIEAADWLLDVGRVVDLPGERGRTPLMEAALAGQAPMIGWLIRQGADAARKDEEGYSALLLAVREGQGRAVEELAAVHEGSLDSALQLAALCGRAEAIDPLTSYGASVYVRMEDGRTPLMLAAENGHLEAVRMLLEVGASRYATDGNDLTAEDHAAANGYQEIVAALRDEGPREPLGLDSSEGLGIAMESGMVEDGRRDEEPPTGGEPSASAPPSARGSSAAVVPLEGAVLSSAAVAGPAEVAGGSPAASRLPRLRMRSYRERELPVRVVTVRDGKAQVTVRGASPKSATVAVGGTIPESRLVVVRVERRVRDSKVSLGEPEEVSIVEVRDPSTGVSREWLVGSPVMAHDPVALVEDAATGRRYLAMPGQRFRSAEGQEFVVSDVRPNQLVIEAVSSGEVMTLPLCGPRG